MWDSNGTNPFRTGYDYDGLRIPPLDSLPITVKFEATYEGEFWDSIGLGDTNGFSYKAYVHAYVGSPIINVTNIEFPNTKVGKWSYGSFEVQNKGLVPLEIYGYKGPTITGVINKLKIYNAQEISDLDISYENPLRIPPGDYVTFNISFTPDKEGDYPDSIAFISNTVKDNSYNDNNPIDSVCNLLGKGVLSGLSVTGYDWGRRRIHRPETFPMEPYPAIDDGVQDSAIRLTNVGYYAESVTRLTNIEEQGDITSFILNRGNLIATVTGGNSKVVPVAFQPTSTGEHLLKIRFSTLDGLETGVERYRSCSEIADRCLRFRMYRTE